MIIVLHVRMPTLQHKLDSLPYKSFALHMHPTLQMWDMANLNSLTLAPTMLCLSLLKYVYSYKGLNARILYFNYNYIFTTLKIFRPYFLQVIALNLGQVGEEFVAAACLKVHAYVGAELMRRKQAVLHQPEYKTILMSLLQNTIKSVQTRGRLERFKNLHQLLCSIQYKIHNYDSCVECNHTYVAVLKLMSS